MGGNKIYKAGFVTLYPQGVGPGSEGTMLEIQPAGWKPGGVVEIARTVLHFKKQGTPLFKSKPETNPQCSIMFTGMPPGCRAAQSHQCTLLLC